MKSIIALSAFLFSFCIANAQAVFINKPYVQIGNFASPSTLKILWHAPDADAKWELELRTNSKAVWKAADTITYTVLALSLIHI